MRVLVKGAKKVLEILSLWRDDIESSCLKWARSWYSRSWVDEVADIDQRSWASIFLEIFEEDSRLLNELFKCRR